MTTPIDTMNEYGMVVPWNISAVAPDTDSLAVFACGLDGIVYINSWTASGSWTGWGAMSAPDYPDDPSFPGGAAVTAISRTPNTIDVFVQGPDSQVWWASYAPGLIGDPWSPWTPIGNQGFGFIEGGLQVAAVPTSSGMDIFVPGAAPAVASGSGVYQASWTESTNNWSGWQRVGGEFEATGPVTAIAPTGNTIFLYVTGDADERNLYNFEMPGDFPFAPIGYLYPSAGYYCSAGTPIAAVASTPATSSPQVFAICELTSTTTMGSNIASLGGAFTAGGLTVAVLLSNSTTVVFAVSDGYLVYATSPFGGQANWQQVEGSDGFVGTDYPFTAVARGDVVDIFAVNDGLRVFTYTLFGNEPSWQNLGGLPSSVPGRASSGSGNVPPRHPVWKI
jgi:hypothetical protein